jgi:DNA-binding CsgD family transcriptional regulator
MFSWREWIHAFRQPRPHRLEIRPDPTLLRLLQKLADDEQRSIEAVANELLGEAVQTRLSAETYLQHWKNLSVREQQVCALVCLNYTNSQIAAQLNLSEETVKTHVRHVMIKFGLRGRASLRNALAGWDFSAWEQGRTPTG